MVECIELGKLYFVKVSRMSEKKILLKAKMPAGSHYTPIVDMHFNNRTLQQGVFVKG